MGLQRQSNSPANYQNGKASKWLNNTDTVIAKDSESHTHWPCYLHLNTKNSEFHSDAKNGD